MVSTRTDLGFLQGPVLDKSSRIIGMIQGGCGSMLTTITIIAREEVKIIGVVFFNKLEIPDLSLSVQVNSNNIQF